MKLKNFFLASVLIVICLQLLSCSVEDNDIIDEPGDKYKSSDHYDFKTVKKINYLGEFELTVFEDEIIFNSKHGSILAPLEYLNNLEKFNFNGIYSLENRDGDYYYFRFGWVEIDDGGTKFLNVNWINGKPISTKEMIFDISTVDIEFLQEGFISVCNIGASQNWWKSSQNLRRYMNYYYDDLFFVGSNTDIYGYGHEAEGGNGTEAVLKRFDFIPKADYYTVLLGVNDYRDDVIRVSRNLIELFTFLSEKFPDSKIIYISPFPTPIERISVFNRKLEMEVLNFIDGKPNYFYFDFKEKIKMNNNWLESLYEDPLHLNKTGVDFFAKELTDELKLHINSAD